ncbi:MAG: type IIL restriction-modification enzyme MmeI [Usitatibacteraceae bacterium]
MTYRGQKEALLEFLPLDSQNWITCGNALRLDWLSICPPTGTGVRVQADDLFGTPLDQSEIDFANVGGETYICGNPPYLGSKWLSAEQKDDLKAIFDSVARNWKSLDYVAGWFMKAAMYGKATKAITAFVSTNSICQGQQVPILWPAIFRTGHEIAFAHTSFKWANLASQNAGVTVVIVGLAIKPHGMRTLYLTAEDETAIAREVENINAYLVPSNNIEVDARSSPIASVGTMQFGNHPYYGAALIFSVEEAKAIALSSPNSVQFIRPLYGAQEFISNAPRACIWVEQPDFSAASDIPEFATRFKLVEQQRRLATQDKAAQKLAETPYRFRDQVTAVDHILIVPRVSSESRPYLPVGLLTANAIVQDQALVMNDAPLWNMALIASRLHLVWIATVCGKLETRYRYSNTLGWNTFPVLKLTEQNKADLTGCAEDILLAREAHFPATIADLYEVKDGENKMPENLRHAHERNDEVLERIYIGRRFKNDTERLEKLFELYTRMTGAKVAA